MFGGKSSATAQQHLDIAVAVLLILVFGGSYIESALTGTPQKTYSRLLLICESFALAVCTTLEIPVLLDGGPLWLANTLALPGHLTGTMLRGLRLNTSTDLLQFGVNVVASSVLWWIVLKSLAHIAQQQDPDKAQPLSAAR